MNTNIYDVIAEKQDILENHRKQTNSSILGLVRFFKNDKLLIDEYAKDGWHTNLTIATGREFVAQSAFKKFHPSSTLGDISSLQVSHFGIGSGGSTTINNTITLVGPTLGDKGLYNTTPINNNSLAAKDNTGTSVANTAKQIDSTGAGNVAGTITFEQSQNTAFTSLPDIFYTVVKCVCVIDNTEPSSLAPNTSTSIDEAMLFVTSGTVIQPFAHITFTPKNVEKEAVFKIEWFVIF